MNNVSTTLPVQGMVWLFFSQGDDGCFHCWHMCTVSGSQCKHQDLYPSTIWSKNCLPLFHTTADVPSKHQIELPSVRCLNCSAPKLQKLFNSPERAWWCDAHSKLMPRHSMICPSIIQQQHCTIWSTVACVSGSAEWGGVGWMIRMCQVFSAAPTIFEHTVNHYHWTHASVKNEHPLVLDLLHTETEWRSNICACPPLSNTLLCSDHRAAWLWHVPFMVGSDHCWNSTRTHDVTLHITRQYMLSAYLMNNPYTLGPYIDCVHIYNVAMYTLRPHVHHVSTSAV